MEILFILIHVRIVGEIFIKTLQKLMEVKSIISYEKIMY